MFDHWQSLTLLKTLEIGNIVEKNDSVTVVVQEKDLESLKYHLEVVKRSLKHKKVDFLVLNTSEMSSVTDSNLLNGKFQSPSNQS